MLTTTPIMQLGRKILRFTLPVWISLSLAAASGPWYKKEKEISGTNLSGQSLQTDIRAFTVSPDGLLLAALYESRSSSGCGVWLALYNLHKDSVDRRVEIAGQCASAAYLAGGIHQAVSFTSDQKFIIVQNTRSVSVLDAVSFRTLYSAVSHAPGFQIPVHAESSIAASRLLLTYSDGNTFSTAFHNEVLDLSSGRQIAEWKSSGIPQSISPDAKLVIAPDLTTYNAGGVSELQMIDLTTGAVLKKLTLNYGFHHRRRNETGSVTARFLDNAQIVISPDNMLDHNGRHSGYSLDIINLDTKQTVHKITPENFGPTGELVVSPDRTYFATVSVPVKPGSTREPGNTGARTELLIWDNGPSYTMRMIGGLESYGLTSNDLLPSISRDSSVVALAQAGKIQIFKKS